MWLNLPGYALLVPTVVVDLNFAIKGKGSSYCNGVGKFTLLILFFESQPNHRKTVFTQSIQLFDSPIHLYLQQKKLHMLKMNRGRV